MKSRPLGTEFSHAYGQTGMTKLTDACRNLVNAPNNVEILFPN
jgi:hypothetical protein